MFDKIRITCKYSSTSTMGLTEIFVWQSAVLVTARDGVRCTIQRYEIISAADYNTVSSW